MKLFVFLLLLAVVVTICSGLSCRRCRRRRCPPVAEVKQSCPGGVVLDACDCCYDCAQQFNESCGGPWGVRGKCDVGLDCQSKNQPNLPVIPPLYPAGVCVKKAGCLLVNGGNNEWIDVGESIIRRRTCKTCVCKSDGTFDCVKQETCDSGTEDIKPTAESKSP